MTSIRPLAIGLAWCAILAWALVTLPYFFPHAEGVRSAAQFVGYNNKIAHLFAAVWLIVLVAYSWSVGRTEGIEPKAWTPDNRRAPVPFILPLVAFILVVFLYFPPVLAWRGPIFEDGIHLNALHRMFAGDLPYRDFEVLYGPLMIYLPALWMSLSGEFSLVWFYAYVVALEAATMILVLIPVCRYIPNLWSRIGAGILLCALHFNVMFGPNQNGLRGLWGPLILLAIAGQPYHRGLWLFSGASLGLLLSYSQEFGAATAIGVFAIYGLLFLKMREARALVALSTIAAVSAAVWLGAVWMMLGHGIGAYFSALRYLTSQFDSGEAAFAFSWTLSALSVFMLLAIAAWQTGRLLSVPWRDAPGHLELLLIGGLGFGLIALKSGLSRSDQWHLAPTIITLCYAMLLPLGSRFIPLPRWTRAIGILSVLIVAATFSFGQWRMARYTFYEVVGPGWTQYLAGERHSCVIEPEPFLKATICQNGQPEKSLVELASLLSSETFRARPLFVYWGSAALTAHLGVRRGGYLTDKFIYGDQRAAETWQYLEAHPDVLIFMTQSMWEHLQQGRDADIPPAVLGLGGTSFWREARTWISSSHYPSAQIEYEISFDRWRSFIGWNIVENYVPAFRGGSFVVLERRQ